MDGLTHITVPIELYSDPNLCEIKRAILGLARSFGTRGVMLSDNDLGAIFGVTRQWVNRLISELAADGYIRIDRPKSRHRKILYCQEKFTVKKRLQSRKVDSSQEPPVAELSTIMQSTVNSSLTQKVITKVNNNPQTPKGALSYSFLKFWESFPPLGKKRVLDENQWRKALDRWNELAPTPAMAEFIQRELKRAKELYAESGAFRWEQATPYLFLKKVADKFNREQAA